MFPLIHLKTYRPVWYTGVYLESSCMEYIGSGFTCINSKWRLIRRAASVKKHHKLCPGFISKCILQKIFELCIGAAETELKHTYTWTHTLSRSLISTISSQSSGLPGGGRRQIQTEEEMGKKGVLDREDWTRQFSAPRGWTCMAGLIG